ncbi:hypothetical protein ACOMHN_006230 [Nucella lapillus]
MAEHSKERTVIFQRAHCHVPKSELSCSKGHTVMVEHSKGHTVMVEHSKERTVMAEHSKGHTVMAEHVKGHTVMAEHSKWHIRFREIVDNCQRMIQNSFLPRGGCGYDNRSESKGLKRSWIRSKTLRFQAPTS